MQFCRVATLIKKRFALTKTEYVLKMEVYALERE